MTNSNLLCDSSAAVTFSLPDLSPCTLGYYTEDDIECIVSLESGASPYPWSRQNIISSLASSHHCLGVRCDGAWIAHAIISLAADEAELLIVSVDKTYQGRGVGNAFLSALCRRLLPFARELFLEVRASNQVAIHLYDSLGFNQMGVRPNYYPSKCGREDALMFGLRLADDTQYE